jgi:hypothetical protein
MHLQESQAEVQSAEIAPDGALAKSCRGAVASSPKLIAYNLNRSMPARLTPASSSRDWMSATRDRFAYRCLPLLIANQAGWFILNSHALSVTWDGSDDITGLRVDYQSGAQPYPAASHFGYGILTWNIPYLFRTPPGFNLLVRGPANWPKDGAYPLEGIVESDWSTATFTINWKMTRAGHTVTFDLNEPICMVVPQRRGELESFRPVIQDIESDAGVNCDYEAWCASRAQFLADLKTPGSDAVKQAWQKHYFRGTSPVGHDAAEHQTKLRLHDFEASGREASSEQG